MPPVRGEEDIHLFTSPETSNSFGRPIAPTNDMEDHIRADERPNVLIDRSFNQRALIGICIANPIIVENRDLFGGFRRPW